MIFQHIVESGAHDHIINTCTRLDCNRHFNDDDKQTPRTCAIHDVTVKSVNTYIMRIFAAHFDYYYYFLLSSLLLPFIAKILLIFYQEFLNFDQKNFCLNFSLFRI